MKKNQGQRMTLALVGECQLISYTVFCRIDAPARTPKNPEGCVYSGLIRSKSNDVGRLRGFPNLQFRF